MHAFLLHFGNGASMCLAAMPAVALHGGSSVSGVVILILIAYLCKAPHQVTTGRRYGKARTSTEMCTAGNRTNRLAEAC